MDGFFLTEQFRDFGPDALRACAAPAVQQVLGKGPSRLRSEVRLLCPAKPGVYGMLDAAGELIYLGKAKELRTRLLSYFRANSRPPKAARILRHAKAIVWEVGTHEFAALLREQELIRRWRPRLNVQGQPLRRRLAFICLGRAPGPYVFLTRQPPRDVQAAFGPAPWTERMVRAVQRVNDSFRLRDCPQPQEIIFPEQGGLFPLVRTPGCLRAELGKCLAPCTGLCPQADYTQQAKAALAFLAGASKAPIEVLETAMRTAAGAQQFELAGALRDQAADLAWLVEVLARLRHSQEAMSFVYPLVGWDGTSHWHLVHGARVVATTPAPVSAVAARQAAALIADVYQGKKLAHLLTPYEHHDGRMIVMQWFRERPREHKKTLTPEQALSFCERWTTSKTA